MFAETVEESLLSEIDIFDNAPLGMRNYIYIIELKRDGTPDEALEQIREKDYARQFTGDPRPIINLGITFSTRTRNITAWKQER